MVTRLDAAQTAHAVQTVAAYCTGPSWLVKQVNHNTQILQDVQKTLQTVLQTLKKQSTSSDGASSHGEGQVWPVSNYKAKNFIQNYKPPPHTDDNTSDANNNVNKQQQRQGGGQQRKRGQAAQNQNQSAAAGTPQQQNTGGQGASCDAGTAPQKQ